MPQPNKFQVGDKVVVVGHCPYQHELGEVKMVHSGSIWGGSTHYDVLLDNYIGTRTFIETDLTIRPVSTLISYAFKTGDQVEVDDFGSSAHGLTGTIAGASLFKVDYWVVVLDNPGFNVNPIEISAGSLKPRAVKAPSISSGAALAGASGTWMNHPWLLPQGFNSLEEATKENKSSPFDNIRCVCGSHSTYGKTIPYDHHSDWCDISIAVKKKASDGSKA